jgi:hypothetical protein
VELNAPWAARITGTTTTGLTVHQILAGLLPVGGGWGTSWDPSLPDWYVPAGAWSWNNAAPISAIHGAATELGMLMLPSRTGRTLTFKKRYPVTPWNFGASAPDVTVPLSTIMSYSRAQPNKTASNAVFVHGAEVGGVQGKATLDGTAGDMLAGDTTHPMVTHIDAVRLLGERKIAEGYRQPTWRELELPLGGVIPLIEVGQHLRIDAGAQSDDGIVSAITVRADIGKDKVSVRQKAKIGENSGNVVSQFRRILPSAPTYLASIISVDAPTGTAEVELLGGSRIRVRGAGTVGGTVYVNSGAIVGDAPSLPVYNVTVY